MVKSRQYHSVIVMVLSGIPFQINTFKGDGLEAFRTRERGREKQSDRLTDKIGSLFTNKEVFDEKYFWLQNSLKYEKNT